MHTKLEKITELKNELINDLCCNKDDITPETAGEITDMIEDLASAEEKCWKACYYKEVVEAMKEAKEEEEISRRMGYNPHRSATTGRYTSGYNPYVPMYGPYAHDMEHAMNEIGHKMGYTVPMHNTGRPYDQYKDARRSYTETRSASDKERMDHHAMEHVNECVETMREIWMDATPELKARMKEDMGKLVNDMKS